jgi:hypothetical protein
MTKLLAEGRTVELALMRIDGTLGHLTTPEHHSGRLGGAGKVPAFRASGRDILERLAEACSQAEIRVTDRSEQQINGQAVIIVCKSGAKGAS